jgi:hypothetical protein
MELTCKLLNDARDEDHEGPTGFEYKAERARLFAAETALQSFALMAAAEGATGIHRHHRRDLEALRGPHGTRSQRRPQICRRRDGRLRVGGVTVSARAEPFGVSPSAVGLEAASVPLRPTPPRRFALPRHPAQTLCVLPHLR